MVKLYFWGQQNIKPTSQLFPIPMLRLLHRRANQLTLEQLHYNQLTSAV